MAMMKRQAITRQQLQQHVKMSKSLRNRRILSQKTLSTRSTRSPSFLQKLGITRSHENHHEQFESSKLTIDAALALTELFKQKDMANMTPVERSAIKIQRHWRITERLRQVRYRNKQVRVRVNSIIIYVLFLVAHFFSTIKPLSEDDNFHFVNNLKGQLTQVEFNVDDSPSWGKNFESIATLLETKQFLHGPFQTFIASHGTYDGADSATTQTDTTSYALGLGRIVGGVRIGQLRGPRTLCGKEKASFTFGDSLDRSTQQFSHIEKLHCYPQFTEENEVTEPFGPPGATPFVWEGWNGTNTERERSQLLTFETVSKSYRSYPSPAYSVILSPADWNSTKSMIKYLETSHYIDLHTRAIFIDILVYNPTLDYLVNCRMIIQFTPAGGAMPTWKANSVRSSPIPYTGGWSTYASISETIIILFYFYFLIEEITQIARFGTLDYFESADLAKYIHMVNIFFYGVVWTLRILSLQNMPMNAKNTSPMIYLEIRSFIETIAIARHLSAVNAFLTWFKLIAYLELSPTFALVTKTLTKSAKKVGGFMVVFFILLISFAFMFMVSFSTVLSQYSTSTTATLSLLRALLGDIDYEELSNAHWFMGPSLFFFFVGINVFVVLNMLIAIISDAYAEVSQEIKTMPNVRLGKEIKFALNRKCRSLPGIRKLNQCVSTWYIKSKNAVRARQRSGNTQSSKNSHHAAAAFQHRITRLAYELEEKRDMELQEELLIEEQNEMNQNAANVQHLKRMERRLKRVEEMLCKIAGVPYVDMEDDNENNDDAKDANNGNDGTTKNTSTPIELPAFVKTETKSETKSATNPYKIVSDGRKKLISVA